MLKDEIDTMLSSLIDNKKAFKKFYKKGYFSYSKDKAFKGSAAIVNNKSIISFLQDVDDDSKVIATATFQDNTTIIIELNGDDFLRTQFGKLPHRCSSNREDVIKDISLLRRYATEAEERAKESIFSKALQHSDRKLSKKDVIFMLQSTIDKLHKSRSLNNRNEISPRVETSNIVTNNTSDIHHSSNDKTPEI